MVHFYEIHPDRKVWGKLNSIEATHAQKLPGIRCSVCGAWALTGVIYPSVNASLLNDIPLPASSSPITIEHFNSLASAIAQVIGVERPIMPGTELGPLCGKAKGTFGDFAWVNPWTPLVRESVWLALNEAGIDLIGVRPELNFGKRANVSLIELEILPRVMLINSPVPKKCSICGRLPMKKPDNIIIDATSFDTSIPLQRVVELPTVIIANESFAQFVQQNNLRDVLLTPIEVR